MNYVIIYYVMRASYNHACMWITKRGEGVVLCCVVNVLSPAVESTGTSASFSITAVRVCPSLKWHPYCGLLSSAWAKMTEREHLVNKKVKTNSAAIQKDITWHAEDYELQSIFFHNEMVFQNCGRKSQCLHWVEIMDFHEIDVVFILFFWEVPNI